MYTPTPPYFSVGAEMSHRLAHSPSPSCSGAVDTEFRIPLAPNVLLLANIRAIAVSCMHYFDPGSPAAYRIPQGPNITHSIPTFEISAVMEPAGLALATFSTLKELYLLSKFVLRVISSAVKHEIERTRLHIQFRQEFLFLKSFGLLFTRKNHTLIDDDELNTDWLRHIHDILEQLRAAYGDYAKLATDTYDEYKRCSPFSPSTTTMSHTIDFSLDIEEADTGSSTTEEHNKGMSRLREYSKKLVQMDWRWALFQKKKLERVLADFKQWNGLLKELVPIAIAFAGNKLSISAHISNRASEEDMRLLGMTTHSQLRKLNADKAAEDVSMYLKDVSLETPEGVQLAPLSLGVLSRPGGLRENVLVEYKPVIQTNTKALGHSEGTTTVLQIDNGAPRLASLLHLAGKSELRTLPLVGYLEKESTQPPQYAFLFKYPEQALESSSPVSLHETIASATNDLSLRDRFAIAYKVAMSLGTFHADNWVHKSVRSQSVVFFHGSGGATMYDEPFLVNFEYSRPADQKTTFTWDQDDEKNIYRHPNRQGPPMRSFDKTHDAYALGVVLLEIGLWQTASEIRDAAKKARVSGKKFDRYDLKEAFVASAKNHLPRLMGVAYQRAVVTCLMGDFSRKVHDPGFGMEFYDKVVQNLAMKRIMLPAKTLEDGFASSVSIED